MPTPVADDQQWSLHDDDYTDSTGRTSIPSVIFVKKTTLLCRWDTGCVKDRNGSALATTKTCTQLTGEERAPAWDDDACIKCLPSTKAKRRRPPSLPTRKASTHTGDERRGSLSSGVSITDIVLLPVELTHSSGCDDDSTRDPVPMARCPLSNLLKLQQAAGGEHRATAIFCIRRAGCGSCRDHGLQLASLTRKLDFSFNLFGIVSAEKEGYLEKFYQDYFPFPIYQDEKKDSFRFLGNRKLSVWQLLRGHSKMLPIYKQKGIKNMPFGGGDLFTQGGVLLFDREGNLRFIYYERYGDELDTDALTWAILKCSQKLNSRGDAKDPPRRPARTSSKSKIDMAARVPTRTTD